MSEKVLFLTPDHYLSAQSDASRKRLYELRALILIVFPQAQEIINYNILAYALVPGGKRDQQIMIAGFAHHVGFYPLPVVLDHFDKELSAYKKATGSVQFPIDQSLPEALIIQMLEYRKSLLDK